MKYILTILLVKALLTDNPELVGIYEYKSAEKDENHYIVFDIIDGQLKGVYFGTEDGKGHGIFFYATDMTNLAIDTEGKIEFEIGDRELFETTQFKIVKIRSQRDEPVGHSRGLLKYKGQINKDKIQLTCTSEFYDCWADELIFERVK
ncbi:MAG: hypothetical protein KIT62_01500 [Cyclobacteriaceae bacterium]|nr:hypothetical protein [Cyclobacteriaceae bacterium]